MVSRLPDPSRGDPALRAEVAELGVLVGEAISAVAAVAASTEQEQVRQAGYHAEVRRLAVEVERLGLRVGRLASELRAERRP